MLIFGCPGYADRSTSVTVHAVPRMRTIKNTLIPFISIFPLVNFPLVHTFIALWTNTL